MTWPARASARRSGRCAPRSQWLKWASTSRSSDRRPGEVRYDMVPTLFGRHPDPDLPAGHGRRAGHRDHHAVPAGRAPAVDEVQDDVHRACSPCCVVGIGWELHLPLPHAVPLGEGLAVDVRPDHGRQRGHPDLAAAALRRWSPGSTRRRRSSAFLIQFILVWLAVWLVANGPMRVPFIRWRFHGGRWCDAREPDRPSVPAASRCAAGVCWPARATCCIACAPTAPETDQLVAVFAAAAAEGVDGNTLVRRVVGLLATDLDGRFPACAVGGPSRAAGTPCWCTGTATAEVTGRCPAATRWYGSPGPTRSPRSAGSFRARSARCGCCCPAWTRVPPRPAAPGRRRRDGRRPVRGHRLGRGGYPLLRQRPALPPQPAPSMAPQIHGAPVGRPSRWRPRHGARSRWRRRHGRTAPSPGWQPAGMTRPLGWRRPAAGPTSCGHDHAGHDHAGHDQMAHWGSAAAGSGARAASGASSRRAPRCRRSGRRPRSVTTSGTARSGQPVAGTAAAPATRPGAAVRVGHPDPGRRSVAHRSRTYRRWRSRSTRAPWCSACSARTSTSTTLTCATARSAGSRWRSRP